MLARDAVSLIRKSGDTGPSQVVDGGMHLLEVLPRLLEAPERRLTVTDSGHDAGTIDQTSLLEALGRQISPRHDCCVIEILCAPQDYSASLIARAVEDADVHLVDMLTNPADAGMLRVTLRVRCEDAGAPVASLERYGFRVENVFGSAEAFPSVALERLLALQTLINV
ncbi:MAG: hypothetical protein K2N88_02070 [Muribaculaceae bacterium]|nr:hypothetical protein [Muribaculaceae bacterium]